MKRILLTSLSLLTLTLSNGQTIDVGDLKIDKLIFRSVMGYRENDSLKSVLCLLGSGFFKAPRTNNIDSLIIEWIKIHPKAKVVNVASVGPASKPRMTYCLLIEAGDTLNNYLVRNGAVPGGTMKRPRSRVSSKDKKFLGEIKQSRSSINYYMDKKSYVKFIDQIISAEKFARDNKLGIWKKENPFE